MGRETTKTIIAGERSGASLRRKDVSGGGEVRKKGRKTIFRGGGAVEVLTIHEKVKTLMVNRGKI